MKTLLAHWLILSFSVANAAVCNCGPFEDYFALFSERVEPGMIQYPITVTHLVDGEFEPNSLSEEYGKESASEVVKILKRVTGYAAQKGAAKSVVKKSKSKYTVKYSGPDSGLLVLFHFEKINECWKLVRFDDRTT